MQRDIKAIVVAHKMDSRRRELYVEGCRDRSFFLWFLRDNRDSNAIVLGIDSVHCEAPAEGGCRGRLLQFASDIEPYKLQVRCFADADFDRLLARPVPANVWLTDCRDLEGYFLQTHCIDKVLHLALVTETHTPEAILGELSRLGRPLALLRLLSEREHLKLPFQKRPPRPYLRQSKSKKRYIELHFDSYLQALLQGVNIGLNRLNEFKVQITAMKDETKLIPDSEFLHGKDCVAILQAILRSDEFKEEAVEPSFWTSLERAVIQKFPNLNAALRYLSRPDSRSGVA
jgi:Protein of unknown function (DUF4435)